MFRRENLYPHAIEKPWSVGGNVRGLIGPIIEVVVTEQADVRHEDSRVNVDSVQRVDVISAISFRYVAVCIGEIPLAISWAGVIPRRRLGIHAELGHQPGANIVPVEVAAHAELL